MSVYSGPKEEQHRPRQLSRLRNEIFQESDDHTFHHDADRIQVPDSQGLVPETQYDQFTEFEHGVGSPNRGESEQPISLEDAAFLNRFKCVRRERTPINTKLFTFPFAQDDEPAGTDFSFVKVAQKGSSNQQQEKSIISIHGSSEQSMSATQTVIVSDNITIENFSQGHQAELRTEDPDIIVLSDTERPLNPFQLKADTSENLVSAAIVEKQAANTCIGGLTLSQSSHLDAQHFQSQPKRKKLKKSRKSKTHRQDPVSWPPKGHNTVGEREHAVPLLQLKENQVLDVLADPPTHTPSQEGKIGFDKAEKNHFAQHVPSDTHHLFGIQDETNANPFEHKANEVTQHETSLSVDVLGLPHPSEVPMEDISLQNRLSSRILGPKPNAHVEVNDEVLHGPSTGGSSTRVNKERGKARSRAMTPLFDADEDEFVNMMGKYVHSLQSKAHDIAEANAAGYKNTIAVLNETISNQKTLIQVLQEDKKELQGKIQSLSTSSKRLQKFAKGMENDYARLKGQAEEHHKSCNDIIKQKVEEIELEKGKLEQEFSRTVVSLSSSQRKMRTLVMECYDQLAVSESKQQSLSKQLQIQTKLYEDEKQKRPELEQQINSAVAAIQANLDGNQNHLSERLDKMQNLLEDTATDEKRDMCLTDCLHILHRLQSSMLTTDDGNRAVKILSAVHQSLKLGICDLTKSTADIKHDSKIQEFVQAQVDSLRDDMSGYGHAFIECRNLQLAVERLQLEIIELKELRTKSAAQVDDHKKKEAEMKLRLMKTELQHKELEKVLHSHQSDSLLYDKEMTDMQSRVTRAENALQDKISALESASQKIEAQSSEITSIKQIAERRKAALLKQNKLIKQDSKNRQHFKDGTELRHAEARHHAALRGMEVNFEKEVDRLRRLNEGINKTIEDIHKEKNVIADRLKATQEDVRCMSAEKDKLVETKSDLENELRKVMAVTEQESIRQSQELENVKQQLLERTEALSLMKQDFTTLSQTQAGLTVKLKALDEQKSDLETHLKDCNLKIAKLGEEVKLRDRANDKNVSIIEEFRGKTDLLQRQKKELEAQISEFKADKLKMLDNTKLEESLHAEISRLQAALESKDKALEQDRREFEGSINEATESHAFESKKLRNKPSHTQKALQEPKGFNNRKIKEIQCNEAQTTKKLDHFSQKIDSDYASKVQDESSGWISATTNSELHCKMARRPVNRNNTSVLNIVQAAKRNTSNSVTNNGIRGLGKGGVLGRAPLGMREKLDDNGVSALGSVNGDELDSQQILGGKLSKCNTITGGADQNHLNSNSPLSDAPSSDVLDMSALDEGAGSISHIFNEKDILTERMGHNVASAHDNLPDCRHRPRSRANTSLRMLPSDLSIWREPSSRNSESISSVAHFSMTPPSKKILSQGVSGSPEYEHRPVSKQNNQVPSIDFALDSSSSEAFATPKPAARSTTLKRKYSKGPEGTVLSKRAQRSSQSNRAPSIDEPSQRIPSTPAGSASRVHEKSKLRATSASSQGATHNSIKSRASDASSASISCSKRYKNDGRRGSKIDARFEEEFQTELKSSKR